MTSSSPKFNKPIAMACALAIGWAAVALVAIRDAQGSSKPQAPLRIAIASSLQEAMPHLFRKYQSETGRQATFVVGSTGELAQQIRAGADIDLFLAADEKTVETLAKQGLASKESIRSFATGVLVLFRADDDSANAPLSLESLTRPEVKVIALANPKTAPYGAAGKQALEKARLWSKVEGKIVYAETIRQTMQYVATGNADAGLVARSVLPKTAKPSQWVEVPPKLYDPIVQNLVVMSESKKLDDAKRFADWLIKPDGQGQRTLKEFGFNPPPTKPVER